MTSQTLVGVGLPPERHAHWGIHFPRHHDMSLPLVTSTVSQLSQIVNAEPVEDFMLLLAPIHSTSEMLEVDYICFGDLYSAVLSCAIFHDYHHSYLILNVLEILNQFLRFPAWIPRSDHYIRITYLKHPNIFFFISVLIKCSTTIGSIAAHVN